MTRHRPAGSNDGFTLLEVLGSLVLLVTAAGGVATLVVVSQRAAQAARLQTSVTTLALEKVEQLRSLSWAVADGLPVSDVTTNLAVDPPREGGSGLRVSPPGSLDRNTAGYVDYLNRSSEWVGEGTVPPPETAFVRRWSVEPHADDPADTLVLRVFVTPVERTRSGAGGPAPGRAPGEALMVTLLTRKTR